MLEKGSRQLRKGRVSIDGQIYMVTAVTQCRRPVFKRLPTGRRLVREFMTEEARGDLLSLAYVVMPDHFHWLVQLGQDACLSTCMRRTKSCAARSINACLGRTGRLWQDGFHDHELRREEDLLTYARYVLANPIRAGLVESLRQYSLWDAIWV